MKNLLKKSFLIPLFSFLIVLSTVGIVNAWTVPVSQHSASPTVLVDEDGNSVSSTNPLPIGSTAISTITDGRKVVTTAGTSVAVGTGAFVSCTMQAEENNTGDIVIGGSGVVADLNTRVGILLTPSASYHFALPSNLSIIYIDSEVNGDGITFSCQS